MLSYEYLKQNPQKNVDRMENGWRSLFTDKDVPYGVKQQLIAFERLDLPFKDCNLYFYDMYTVDKLSKALGYYTLSEQDVVVTLQRTTLIDAMYTQVQLEPSLTSSVKSLFYFICEKVRLHCWWVLDELTFLECSNMIKTWNRQVFAGSLELLLFNSIQPHVTNGLLAATVEYGLTPLFRVMSIRFMRTASAKTINNAAEIVEDAPKPPNIFERYNSLAELTVAHDTETARVTQELIKQGGGTLRYHATFSEIVTKYGFYLPSMKNEFIIRGNRHHNCVATYADRHCMNDCSPYTRLLFTKDATAEIRIWSSYQLIVSTSLEQFKGRYNKELEPTLAIAQLQIELTGQPVSIIHVEEEYA